MAMFSATVTDGTTGSSANTFKTMLGLKLANTTGHRAYLRSLTIQGGGGAAQDLQVNVRVVLSDNTSDGTSTAVTVGKLDFNSIASRVAAAGKNYSVEPTTIDTSPAAIWEGGFNTRGGLEKYWGPGEGPVWGPNKNLLIRCAPGSATAARVIITAIWEE